MRKTLTFIGLTLAASLPTYQAVASEPTKDDTNDVSSVSYFIGYQLGNSIKAQEIAVDKGTVVNGMNDALAGKEPTIDMAKAQTLLQEHQKKLLTKKQEEMKQLAEQNKNEADNFLAENKKKSGVVTLPSGLQYEVVNEGEGDSPAHSDTVVTHYKGTLADGTQFDSSYDRGQPATFPVNGVIKGWSEALQLMKPGAKWRLVIPPELGYGARGAGRKIPPNAVLVFDVELLEVKKVN